MSGRIKEYFNAFDKKCILGSFFVALSFVLMNTCYFSHGTLLLGSLLAFATAMLFLSAANFRYTHYKCDTFRAVVNWFNLTTAAILASIIFVFLFYSRRPHEMVRLDKVEMVGSGNVATGNGIGTWVVIRDHGDLKALFFDEQRKGFELHRTAPANVWGFVLKEHTTYEMVGGAVTSNRDSVHPSSIGN